MNPFDRFKPQAIESTGDDRPVRGILQYVMRMSGRHQIAVCLLAILIAPLNLVPVELQRRIVNDIVARGDVEKLFLLGAVFLAVVIIHQILKFALRMYQNWIAESAVIYTRQHLIDIHRKSASKDGGADSSRAIPVIVRETDNLGSFVGSGVSQAVANVVILTGVVGYMFFIEARIALVSLLFFVPQIVITPFVQRHLNKLTEKRLGFLRSLGQFVGAANNSDGNSTILSSIFRNKMAFSAIKFLLKAVRNLLTMLPTIAALVFGGYLAITDQVEIGTIVAFIAGFERMSGPLRELLAFYSLAAQADVQHRMIADWIRSNHPDIAPQ